VGGANKHQKKNNDTIIMSDKGVLFDSAVLTSLNGNAVKVGLSGIVITTLPNDLVLDFTVLLTDSDKDTRSVSFKVGIDGDGNGSVSSIVPMPFSSSDHLMFENSIHLLGVDANLV
jgi:hypothetical protein